MNRPDLQVFLVNFPSKGNEAITKNEDDTYTVFINAKLSYEKQLEAYHHALKHLQNVYNLLRKAVSYEYW